MRPGGAAEDLQGHVGERGAVAGRQLGDRHHEGALGALGAGEDLDHREAGALAGPHRGAGEAGDARGSHQCTIEHGPATVTPAGTSTNTGSGAKASLRRTSASPPSCTAPEQIARPGHVVGPAEGEAGRRRRREAARRRPLCTSTLPASDAERGAERGQQLVAGRAGPSATGGANSSRASSLIGV